MTEHIRSKGINYDGHLQSPKYFYCTGYSLVECKNYKVYDDEICIECSAQKVKPICSTVAAGASVKSGQSGRFAYGALAAKMSANTRGTGHVEASSTSLIK
jgi:hypothetical protein